LPNGGGAGSSGEAGASGGTNGGGQAGTVATDEIPPTVLSITPLQDAIVKEGTPIVVRFSEAMNKAATQAAFAPTNALPEPAGFKWSDDGKELTIDAHLRYPEGPAPDQVEPFKFSFSIATAARDLSGNPLPAAASRTFSLEFKRIIVPLAFDQETSGNIREGGSRGTFLMAGDSSENPGAYHAFITFPFTALPTGLSIESATLRAVRETTAGDPFSKFGAVYVADQVWSAVNLTSYGEQYTQLGVLFSESLASVDFDVTKAFLDDYKNRVARSDRSQFRVYFQSANIFKDTVADQFRLLRPDTKLRVVYLAK
jgi:hypothetical protein